MNMRQKTALKPQILLERTVNKTMILFLKSLKNLKSYFTGGKKKLTKTSSMNSFCTNYSTIMQELDNFHGDLSEQYDYSQKTHNAILKKSKSEKLSREESRKKRENATRRSLATNAEQNAGKNAKEKERNEEKKRFSYHESKRKQPRDHSLIKKMQELEMLDMNDEDHALDIEEVLHCYSLLTSPVYQDIVENFFTDMHSEFFLPKPSTSVNNSKSRPGPLKL